MPRSENADHELVLMLMMWFFGKECQPANVHGKVRLRYWRRSNRELDMNGRAIAIGEGRDMNIRGKEREGWISGLSG